MNDTAITFTNNKKYTKVDEYEAFFIEEDSTKSIEYKERLIDYNENYESYDSYQDWDGSEIFY